MLPLVVHPPDTLCFQLEIPNDPGYLSAFYGAIGQLAQWRTWELDDAHTANDVAAVWRAIYFALSPDNCVKPKDVIGTGGEDDFMLRQNPDNPCLLESSVDGITWCAWADLSKCLTANPAQPGPAGPGPTSGNSQIHCLSLDANGKAILPIAVQGNWTIELLDREGGWTDGAAWYCPNGDTFVGGLCSTIGRSNSGGDPVPSAWHMSTVAEINGAFYDGNSLIIVPSGLTDQQVVFQANDASLSDNSGNIHFCVKVTNPPVGPIFLTYNFGSGPASVVDGQVVTFTATCCGGGGAGDWQINVQFSEPVKVTFVNQSGFSCAGSSHDLYMFGEHPLGTQVQLHYQDIDCGPNFWSPGTTIDLWSCETGGGQTVWTCQVRIDRA